MPTARAGGPDHARPSVLVVGVSTRAMAESAARAGFAVTSVDAFGDLDQARGVRALAVHRDFGVRYSTSTAARLARDLPGDAVAYGAGFENDPRAVAQLADSRTLWGNAPGPLAAVRDPLRLARALQARGFPVPDVRATAPRGVLSSQRWLLKARASGGGRRVRVWRSGVPVGRRDYVQERIDGFAGSVVFAANGHDAVPFAMTRQLVGERDFGATGFRYCGSILAPAGDTVLVRSAHHDARLLDGAVALARAVASAFGLVGVGSVDFIASEGVPLPIEVNPRWSASMELAERAYDLSVFAAHARGCTGSLPALDLGALRRRPGAIGKAVIYARRSMTVGDTHAWLADGDVRDVPHPGERIARGKPVCTIFARGRDGAACRAALAERAARLYAEIEGARAHRARRSA